MGVGVHPGLHSAKTSNSGEINTAIGIVEHMVIPAHRPAAEGTDTAIDAAMDAAVKPRTNPAAQEVAQLTAQEAQGLKCTTIRLLARRRNGKHQGQSRCQHPAWPRPTLQVVEEIKAGN